MNEVSVTKGGKKAAPDQGSGSANWCRVTDQMSQAARSHRSAAQGAARSRYRAYWQALQTPHTLPSRPRSGGGGGADRWGRGEGRGARPIPSVLASAPTPRCAPMASPDRQMIGDTTLVPADAPERHRLAPCAHRCWYFLAPGNRCKVAARCICRSLPMTSLRPFPALCRLRPWLHWSLLAAMLGALCGSAGAQQTKALTFAHQDMLVPLRLVMESGEIEKATGYK